MDSEQVSPFERLVTQAEKRLSQTTTSWTERERRILMALAEAVMPPGHKLPAAGPHVVDDFLRWIAGFPGRAIPFLRATTWAVEFSPVATRYRPFSALPLEARMALLAEWENHPSHPVRALLRGLVTLLKQVHFDRAEMFKYAGCPFELPTVKDEEPRWLAQVTNGREIEEDLDLECEVVVVGTGAGGAAVAYELSSRGHAVLMLEEGDYHRRSEFNGRPTQSYRRMYRDQGVTLAVGNTSIPIWAGRAVGGSTVINSGTCYRTPERTLRMWRERFGLPDVFSSQGMDPYFKRVESMLQVTQANPMYLGAVAPLIAKGASRLGYRHGPLSRNAPECDGQGLCCFGCPTGAKRSTDVSYVPEALKAGAQLITAARVDSVDIVAGRARGVTATLRGNHKGKRPQLRVKANAVIVACGTLYTPGLLRRSGACKTSGMLGKNLSVHPATKVVALFHERVDQFQGIPQGYAIEQFADEGLMFEGGSLPFDVMAVSVPWTGHRFMELMQNYRYMATFGLMIQDESRGEILRGPGRSPLIVYNLNKRDTALMKRGIEVLCRVYQEAGAKRVLPFVAGADELSTRADVERFKAKPLRAGDIEVTAFHPLGTCRMGMTPRDSCVGPDHEAHDVAGLYVCDGSAVPSSLGVNPQITIMAMAVRAAEIIHSRLD